MPTERFTLQGKYVRLEPLEHHHVDGLVAAAANDRELYRWSPVPQSKDEAKAYVDTALAWRDAGSAVSFAIVDDPQTWDRAWTGEYPWNGTRERIFEYACHEGNYSLENMLRGARAKEAEEAAAKKK